MELAVPLVEFLDRACRRCFEPMAAHRIRPLHVSELPDLPAAELICPLLVLDLGKGVTAHAVPTLRPDDPGRRVLGGDRPRERRPAVRSRLPLRPNAAPSSTAGAADGLTVPQQPSPRG
jgi:hypothetical protein